MNVAGIRRREALKRMGAGSLLALGLWPGVLKASNQSPASSFRFIVVNDLHYMSPECGEWLEDVVRIMRSHDTIEFCIIAGDLTEHGRPEDLAAVRDIFKSLGMPVFVQIGNHDYTAQSERAAYEKLFPKRLNYHFEHRGWQFVGLDTTEGLKYQNTQIGPHTFEWVRDHLSRLDNKAPLIIFTHFPLGPGVRYRPGNADALLALFQDHNLVSVFSGHFHGFTERRSGANILTTNVCCALKRGNHDSSKQKGYFVCTAGEGRVARRFVEYKPEDFW